MFEAQTLPQGDALTPAPALARAGGPTTLYSSHLAEAICARPRSATPEIAHAPSDAG